MPPDIQSRGVLSKLREYLLGDFEYAPRPGANLDYEDCWAALPTQESGP